MLLPEKALVICLVALYMVLTIGNFAKTFSPQLKIVLPRTFVINNPKASASCGCGLSFSV